jgi:hypothetical protein
MSGTIIPHHPTTHRPLGAGRNALLAAVVVLIVGGLGLAVAVSTIDVVRASYASLTAPAPAEPIAAYPVRELPPEWRWSPPSVAYKHMYNRKGSARLDWIRAKGSR